jgi:hypothetical protein
MEEESFPDRLERTLSAILEKFKRGGKPEDIFDPEGDGYDYKSAKAAGISPDKTGHWSSRDPNTGMLLKGAGHETWHKTLKGEEDAGYEVYKNPKNGRYYSRKKGK